MSAQSEAVSAIAMSRKISPGAEAVVEDEPQFQPDHHARTKT
jgi:hypothetical protein